MLVALGFPAAASLLAGSTAVRSMPPAAARRAACFLNAAPEDGYGGRSFEGQIAQFAPPQTLLQVRGQRQKVQQELSDAINDEDYVTAALLRDDLMELKQKDPAVMAAILREEQAEHVAHEQYDEAARCRDELLVLRRFLPQYQLAGLWKGNYPNHGDEMVRLHYQGDQLFATKVTGDEHVPAGEVTFRADLAAPADSLSEDLGSAGRSYGGTSTVCATPPRATLFPPGSSVLSPPPLPPLLLFCVRPPTVLAVLVSSRRTYPRRALGHVDRKRSACALRCLPSPPTAATSHARWSSSMARGASPRGASDIRILCPGSSS